MSALPAIDPPTPKRRLDEGSAVLIDIRERAEHAREHIAGDRLAPLSTFDRQDLGRDEGKAMVFYCLSGTRTTAHAARFAAKGFKEGYVLAGGLNAWKAAGLPTRLDRSQPIDLMRQVQIAAGVLILLGVALGAAVSPWFYGLSGFVGAGLVFAGATGFCGMARLLGLMPWNRRSDPAAS